MVSVIVPVFNAEIYLCSCVNSILKQTYRDFELLLIEMVRLIKVQKSVMIFKIKMLGLKLFIIKTMVYHIHETPDFCLLKANSLLSVCRMICMRKLSTEIVDAAENRRLILYM